MQYDTRPSRRLGPAKEEARSLQNSGVGCRLLSGEKESCEGQDGRFVRCA